MNRGIRLVSTTALRIGCFWTESIHGPELGAPETSTTGPCAPASANAIAAHDPCIHPVRRVALRIEASGAQHGKALIGDGGAQTRIMDMVNEIGIGDAPQTVSVAPISVNIYRFPVAGAAQ